MKFMEKAKRFFTLSAKHEGFTLVELIVVIAILAILAGVAIPAYSGYIKKAQEAGDQTLLAAVNKAFAAACLENGVDAVTQPDGTFAIRLSDGKVAAVSDFEEEFDFYYAGNEGSAFKTITALYFQGGVFVDAAEAGGAYTGLLNNIMNKNPQWATALNNSIWMTNDKLGTNGLLNKLNDVTGFVSGADSAALSSVMKSPEFQTYAAGVLGVDPSDTAAFEDKLGSLAADLAKKDGISIDDAKNQVMTNAAVLYAASNSANMDVDSVVSLLGTNGAKDKIKNELNGSNKGAALSQAAAAYAMYTAYAYNTGKQDLIDSTEDPLAILNGLDDPEFQKYINDSSNHKDIEGYLSAMNMVGSSANDPAALDQLMVNGFDDPALSAMLNQLGSAK